MGLYECTLYEKPKYGDPRPVVIDGQTVSCEIVADNAGKARYRWWLNLTDCRDDIRLQDIRVRSLNHRKAAPMADGWERRLELSNAIIRVIASHGRRFFSEDADRLARVENPFVSHFTVDRNGELWLIDKHTRKPVLVRLRDEWRHFSDGGTLRAIVEHLAEHIRAASPINPRWFGISPDWMPNHWGYGDDMARVADRVRELLVATGEKERA
jgi:hypothetical protein